MTTRPYRRNPSRPYTIPLPDLSKLKPVPPLERSAVIEIVQGINAHPTVSHEEVAAASKRRGRAGRLLAAAAVHNMRESQDPTNGTPWHSHNLLAFLAVDAVNEQVAGMKGRRNVATHERTALALRWHEQHEAHGHAAQGFEALLGAVGMFDNKLTAYIADSNEPKSVLLEELYDASEALEHPLLAALPPAHSLTIEDERNAVVWAGNLLRYIVLQAQPVRGV